MVDEFSSFARMPKALLGADDLAECVRQVLFLMRVGHPDIDVRGAAAGRAGRSRDFDRRLMSQALTNIVKNATEGVAALPRADTTGRRRRRDSLGVARSGFVEIEVIDNGKGFPTENRQRLLEPYMTTRAEGTGLGLPIVAKIFEDHGGGIELLDGLVARRWRAAAPKSC